MGLGKKEERQPTFSVGGASIDSTIAVSYYYNGIYMVGQPFNDSKDQQVYTEPEDNQVT